MLLLFRTNFRGCDNGVGGTWELIVFRRVYVYKRLPQLWFGNDNDETNRQANRQAGVFSKLELVVV